MKPKPILLPAYKLAIWAFAQLLNPQSKHAQSYPLDGAIHRVSWQDRSAEIILKESNSGRPKKTIPKAVSFRQQIKAVEMGLRELGDAIKRHYKQTSGYYPGLVALKLGEAVNKLNKLLVELTALGDKTAAENFVFCTRDAVNDLQTLSRREDIFASLQAIAAMEAEWPVTYSPHPSRQRELLARMKRLGVGTQAVQKIVGASWTNKFNRDGKPGAGVFANRMGWMLWRLHYDMILQSCLCRRLAVRTGDANSPEQCSPAQWERRLKQQGWPLWIVRLHQLPRLTKKSADAWFEVGWLALHEATGDNLAQIPELAALGKSNVDYAIRRVGTDRGERGKHKSRMESQIKRVLRNAFLSRWGNPNLRTNPDMKSP